MASDYCCIGASERMPIAIIVVALLGISDFSDIAGRSEANVTKIRDICRYLQRVYRSSLSLPANGIE
jgi:hypothetical protein